ncbi:DUF2935 domain-containing protein [Clostridium sp. C2-6-12]|uniref:DUF2935 domain-containing protein n=1 Tax=Clostridium sp. C2-6-12 TaxID=2698832 RepID=UPI00136D7474|nr:DUF2935 domain-containing protein [Clostridium sp. C2-6-12]
MEIKNIKEISLWEHNFWLQILGDHSRFILNALSPKETQFVQQAVRFINLFDDLLKESHKQISDEKFHDLNYKAYSAAMEIRELKLNILSKQIYEKIDINLPPTFINHMINELEEYICILNNLIKGDVSVTRDIQLHMLWLPDGVGHADSIASTLDMTQKELIKKSKEYSKLFTNLYLALLEYKGYTRTGICEFPALNKLNVNASDVMSCFKKFLKELEVGILEKEIIGTLSPLMADHMFREECYYLTKLAMVAGTKNPACDPTKPRIEG